jgi:uncharacterized protein (TIGR03435 family)
MNQSDACNIRASRLSIALMLLALPVYAQQPAAAPPAPLPVYDIVSIHPHDELDDNIGMHTQDSIYTASGVTLKELVSYAYRIREDLVSGLPGWGDSTRFDITAKISEPDLPRLKKLTREQREAMFLPILADRFQVKAHTEIKTLPVFDLVLTKDGPKFKPTPHPATDPDHPNKHPLSITFNNNDLTASSISMSDFADTLSFQVSRTVIDKTGLTGVYDLKLRSAPYRLANTPADNGATDRPPDLFTALKEQLGLKLDSAKGPVETLVVDHAKKPSPN